MAHKYVRWLGDAHLQVWGPTLPLYFAHLLAECTHFCHPSAYQLWVFLLAQLLEGSDLLQNRTLVDAG